jgi:hypothetical protein
MDYVDAETWDGFRYLVFAEQFRGTFRALPGFLDAIQSIGAETLAQLGLFAVLAIVGVLATAWRRPALMFLLALWFGVNWFFALGYINADIGRYYLVPLLAAAMFGGLGAGAIVDWFERFISRSSRPVAAAPACVDDYPDADIPEEAAPPRISDRSQTADGFVPVAFSALAAVVLLSATLASVPDRFRQVDSSQDHLARTWLDSVMPNLPEDAVVVSWWSYSTTLWYAQYVDRLRPDVTVIDDSTIVNEDLGNVNAVIDSYLGQRPVFLIRLSYDLPSFEERYVLTPLSGVLGSPVYRVDGMRAEANL